jgi:ParB family chromosome partitioning protein
MSDNTPNPSNSPKKARLGRGLGSLLGGGSNFDSAAPAAAVEPTAQKPATQAKAAQVVEQAAQKAATQPVVAQAAPVTTPLASQTAPKAASTQPMAAQIATPASQTAAVAAPAPTPAPARPINEEAQIWKIAVDRLKPNTQQPRQIFTQEALRDLTASIKEKGILQPIVARRLNEKEFEIIAGERRWRAAQAAGLHEVPVILKKVSEQDSLELAIIENIQRENLNPLEEAEAYDRLMIDYSLTQQQVADKLGKERPTVANTLRLLTLPKEVKEFLRKNELSAGHAKVLLGIDNVQTQISIARQVVNEKLSVRATEKLVAKAKSDARGETKPEQNVNLNVSRRLIDGLSSELQKLIGTRVAIDYAEGKGKLSVNFYSDEQLTQIVEKLRKAWEK